MHLAGRRLAANVSGLDEEYFEALEAFEAVQAHDYLMRASETPMSRIARPEDSPAPEDDDFSLEADDEADSTSPALTARGQTVSPCSPRVRSTGHTCIKRGLGPHAGAESKSAVCSPVMHDLFCRVHHIRVWAPE